MDESLASLDALRQRLDWDLAPEEERVALSALEDLSHEARFLGSDSWTAPNTTPPYIRTLVLKAAVRYLKNAEGYIQSRAGDEAVMWPEIPEIMGTASFTKGEEAKITGMARPAGLHSVGTYAYSNRRGRGGVGLDPYRVPTSAGGKWYPFLSDEDLRRVR